MIDASVVDLPEPVGSGDQHQPARPLRQFGDHGRQAQLLKGQDLEGNGSKRARHRAALHEDVRAKARQPLHAERQVELVVFFELVLLGVGENRVAKLLRFDRGERWRLQLNQFTVDAQLRRRAGGDVQIARALLDHRLQQLVQVGHGKFLECEMKRKMRNATCGQARYCRPLLRAWCCRSSPC